MTNIDILEEKIKNVKKYNTYNYTWTEKDIEAIETLIAENKELKERNKKIKQEYINPNKARISYFDYKKRTNVVIEGFIPKSKVKEEIKEVDIQLQKLKDELTGRKTNFVNKNMLFAQKEVLQSLLGKE